MLSQNSRKAKFGVEILIIMPYTKVHDLCVTLVGVALSFIYVTLHFMQSSGWRIGKRLLGAVYYMVIKEM